MMTSTSPEQLLQAVDQIEISELRRFVSEIIARASQRLAPSLSTEETELLQKINRGLLPSVDQRCRELNAKPGLPARVTLLDRRP